MSKQNNYRRSMITKIQIEYPKLRPDLRGADLRDERLGFYQVTLGLKLRPESTKQLSNDQLAAVLDAITRLRGQKPEVRSQKSEVRRPPSFTTCTVRPLKPQTREAIEEMGGLAVIAAGKRGFGCGVADPQPGTPNSEPGTIFHLAGNEHTWAIARVFEYLEWDDDRQHRYISSRFGAKSAKTVRPDQAKSLLYQLFLCAAHRDLKIRLGPDVKITRDQEKAEIPAIKRTLGIDR